MVAPPQHPLSRDRQQEKRKQTRTQLARRPKIGPLDARQPSLAALDLGGQLLDLMNVKIESAGPFGHRP